MHFKVKTSWFTLVELIVVITILTILWTIGFISIFQYQTIARDSIRNSDLQIIQRALEYYKLQSGFYPEPQDSFDVTYSGSLAWKQGVYGEETRVITGRISQVPLDPVTWNPYTYSTTYNRQEFQLSAIMEWGLFSYRDVNTNNTPNNNSLLTHQAHAQSYTARVIGNYNGRIITLNEPGRLIILWVPSIISSEIESVDIRDIFSRGSLVLNNSSNLPSSYHNTSDIITDIFQAPSFIPGTITWTPPVLYDDTYENFNTAQWQQSFWENIIAYYSESNIANTITDVVPTSSPLDVAANYIQAELWGLDNREIMTFRENDESGWWIVSPPSALECITPGQECTSIDDIYFAWQNTSNQYIYVTKVLAPQFWHIADQYCKWIGAGWNIFNRADRNLLAIPWDPLNVDFTTPSLWGIATVTWTSGSFVNGQMVTNYTWSSNSYNIYSQNQDGNFNLHNPFGQSLVLTTLGTNNSNTLPPENNSIALPFICSLQTSVPIN